MSKDELLEMRDLKDVLDRVIDKGIVVDAATRIAMQGMDLLDHEQVVVGTFDTRLEKRAA